MAVTLNGESIVTVSDPDEWEPHVLQHMLHERLAGTDAKDIILRSVHQSSDVTNEVLDLLANLPMPPEGLRCLSFILWRDGMDKPLVPDVIERFGARSTNLQTFKVEDMYMAG